MKVCVLQPPPQDCGNKYVDLAKWAPQHSFVHKDISKANAASQIDDAISEKYDIYLNFMRGRDGESVAGVDAVRHLESRGVPFVGVPSRVLERSTRDVFRDMAAAGLVVPEDVQQHVEGQMFSCLVVEMHGTPVASVPCEIQTPAGLQGDSGLPAATGHSNGVAGSLGAQKSSFGSQGFFVAETFSEENGSRDPLVYLKPLEKDDNPDLYQKIVELAVAAFKAAKMHGASWCNVVMQLQASDNQLVLIGVDPVPAVFRADSYQGGQDLVIQDCFPGGHQALINILVSSKLWELSSDERLEKVKEVYDAEGPKYAKVGTTTSCSNYDFIIPDAIGQYDCEGVVLDVACGTGRFGAFLRSFQGPRATPRSKLIGLELSEGMVKASKSCSELYEKIHIGSMQEVLPQINGPIDHIVSFTALHYLDPNTFSLVLNRMFSLASKSVTITIDDVTETYLETLRELGTAFMYCYNLTKELEDFGVPKGWKLVEKTRHFAWQSSCTGHKIDTTFCRFERDIGHC